MEDTKDLRPRNAEGKLIPYPGANFAKKEKAAPAKPLPIAAQVTIPPVYYWEDVFEGKSVLMTVAFKWRDRSYGMSFPITDVEEKDFLKKKALRLELAGIVRETCDVLVHHGEACLDSSGNPDPVKVNEQEAIRWKHDQLWDRKVAAFNKLFRVRPITRRKAVEMGLLDTAR